jgi:hypothetical protein
MKDLDVKFAFPLGVCLIWAEVSTKFVSEIVGVCKLELSRIAE